MWFLKLRKFLCYASATITLMMVADFSFANYCDMESCGTKVLTDSNDGVICNRFKNECECATLPSDCYAAQRMKSCTGNSGWSVNHGKMIGSKDGNICCGYKLEANKACPEVKADEKPIVRTKDYSKGFFVNDFFAWNGSNSSSVNGGRDSFYKAYLDICIGSHHVKEISHGTVAEKLSACLSKCNNKGIPNSCKKQIVKNTSICFNNCFCWLGQSECIKK